MKLRNNNTYVVYFHRNNQTREIFYVGIGHRERAYSFYECQRNKFWVRYVKKYGMPIVELVHEGICLKEAAKLEVEYISLYGRRNNSKNGVLVNLTDGGECTAKGYKHTKDARKRISEALSKRVYTPEMKKKRSDMAMGKKHTFESKLKNSIAHRGDRHPHFGKPKSEETKKKIGDANRGKTGELNAMSKKVINTKTKEVFPSALYVAKTFFPNMHPTSFSMILRGINSNRTDFQYLDDYNSGKEKWVTTHTGNVPKRVKHNITGKEYNSICDAARDNGVSDGAIHFHLKNKLTKSKPLYSYID
jgi:hypothetical protein